MTRILRILDTMPTRGALWGRVQLARSILSHRPWCDTCRPHAEQAHAVLNGEPVQPLPDKTMGV